MADFDPFKDGGAVAVEEFDPFKAGAIPVQRDAPLAPPDSSNAEPEGNFPPSATLEVPQDYHLERPMVEATPTISSELMSGNIGGAGGIALESARRMFSRITGPTKRQQIEEAVPVTQPDGSTTYEYRPQANEIEKRGLVPAFMAAGSAIVDAPSAIKLAARGERPTLTNLEKEFESSLFQHDPSDSGAMATAKGVANAITRTSRAVANPAFLKVPSSRALSGLFAADMAHATAEQMKAASEATTTQGKVEGWLGAALSALFTYGAAHHAGMPSTGPKPEVVVSKIPQEQFQSIVESPDFKEIPPDVAKLFGAEAVRRKQPGYIKPPVDIRLPTADEIALEGERLRVQADAQNLRAAAAAAEAAGMAASAKAARESADAIEAAAAKALALAKVATVVEPKPEVPKPAAQDASLLQRIADLEAKLSEPKPNVETPVSTTPAPKVETTQPGAPAEGDTAAPVKVDEVAGSGVENPLEPPSAEPAPTRPTDQGAETMAAETPSVATQSKEPIPVAATTEAAPESVTSAEQSEYRASLSDPEKVVELSRRPDGTVVLNADSLIAKSPDMEGARDIPDPSARFTRGQQVYDHLKSAADDARQAGLEHLLSKPGSGMVAITVGGPGSGKSTFLDGVKGAEFIVDSVHGDEALLQDRIQSVVDHGRTAHVAIIVRKPSAAMRGNLYRATEENRMATADSLAASHVNARNAFNAAVLKFGDNPKVKFSAFESLPGNKLKPIALTDVQKLDVDQARAETHSAVDAIVNGTDPEWQHGELPVSVVQRARGSRRSTSGDDGRGAEGVQRGWRGGEPPRGSAPQGSSGELKPFEGDREKLHTDAYSIAETIAGKVASGQPDSVREAAFDAAYKNAFNSIEDTGAFNPSFMRKAAMSAAGKEAEKLGTSLDAPVAEGADATGHDLIASREAGPVENAQAATMKEVLDSEMAKLPENQRRIMEETANDTPISEIAEKLGITEGSVVSLRSKARKTLAQSISDKLGQAIDATKREPGKLYADPFLIEAVGRPALRAALQVMRAAIEAGRPIFDAIEEAILSLRASVGEKWNADVEATAREFFAPITAVEKPPKAALPKPPIELPKKPTPRPAPESLAEPPPEPAGSTESSEPVSSGKSGAESPVIQLRMAFTDAEREKMGIPPWVDPNRITNREAWERGLEVLAANPDAATPLIREALTHPRALEPFEKAIILREQVKRNAEFIAAVDAKNAAKTPTAILSADMRLAAARDANQEIFDVDRAMGRAAGQSLQAQKMNFDTETQTLARMEAVIQSILKPGDKLENHPKLLAEIADLHAKLAEERAKTAAAEAAAKEADISAIFDRVMSDIKAAKKSKGAGETLIDFGKKMETAARDRLRARSGGRLFSGLDPLDLLDHAQIGASWIIQGIGNLAKFTTKLVDTYGEAARPHAQQIYDASKQQADLFKASHGSASKTRGEQTPAEVVASVKTGEALSQSDIYDLVRAHIAENPDVKLDSAKIGEIMATVAEELQPIKPGITEGEVRDIFSGYGKEHKPLSRDAINVKMRELHAASGVVSKLERAIKGEEVKKIGPQRDRPTPLVRELTKELVRTMRANGIDTATAEGMLKTAHDARVTRLTNAIEDTQRQIDQGKRTPKTPGTEWTPEEMALKDQLTEMKSKLDDLLNEPDSDEVSRVMDRIEAVTDKLASGDIAPKAKNQNVPTQKLSEARDKLAELNTELSRRRKAQRELENPPKTEEEKQLETLQNQEETLAERIRTGSIDPATGKPTVDTHAVAAARDRVEVLRAQISDLRKAKRLRENPPKSDEQKYLESLQKRNTKARDLLASKTLFRKPGSPQPSSPEITAARADLHQTNRLLAEARKASTQGIQRNLDTYRKMIDRKTEALRDRITRKDFAPPPKRVVSDAKTKAAVPYKLLQEKWETMKRTEELKNQNALQKTLRWSTYLAHEMLLLGSTVGQKLATAALTTSAAVSPLEEVAGFALGKALPFMAEKSEVEIAPTAKSLVRGEAHAAAQGMLRAIDDIGSMLKYGKSDFELEFGKHYDNEMVSWVGRLHGSLKTVPARQAFTRTFERLSEKYAARGLDPTDPDVRIIIGTQALLKAQEAKFQDPNMAVGAFKAALRFVEQKDANVGAVTKAVARTEMPVMTVASNITWRVFESVYGVPVASARLAGRAITDMLSNTFGKKGAAFALRSMNDMTTEQVESIAKQFKRGSVGAAAFLIGAYAYKNLGGFYQPGKQDKKGAVKEEEIRTPVGDIPKEFIHHPAFTVMQAGAATIQVAQSRLRKSDRETQGLGAGFLSAGVSVAEESPFGGTVESVGHLFDPYTRLDAVGQFARTMLGISGPVSWLAKHNVPFTNIGGDEDASGEVVRRKARTFGEELKMGIPGLRKDVPKAKKK